MSQLNITNAKTTDIHQIAQLIAKVNSDPAHHCLHCDQETVGILEEIKLLEVLVEDSFVTAWKGDQMVGVLGADVTSERDRAWLWGPFIEGADWGEMAEALYNHLTTNLLPSVQQLNQFLNAANEQGRAFYLSKGFKETKTSHVYRALPPAKSVTALFPEITPPQWRSFIELHEETFPNTYYSGREIIERLGKKDKIFVCPNGETTSGYVYANVEPSEGFIHFLAVREEMRGRGIGERLLLTAVSWLFKNQKVPQVSLVVDDQNNARRLYEKSGFSLLHSGVGLRKEM